MGKRASITFRGVCHLFFETGTEGCHWTFQDERFMSIPDPETFVCEKCGRVWDKKQSRRVPKRSFDGECKTAKEHLWKLLHPQGVWAYEGLHALENGDLLTVYDKADPTKTLWSGKVSLQQRKTYTEFVVDGMIVHAVPKNVPIAQWKTWFFEEYPAELTLGKRSLVMWEKHFREGVEKKLRELGKA